MNEKQLGLLTVVLSGLCAVLWSGLCVHGLLLYGETPFLKFLCAIGWSVLFFIQLKRFRREEE